MPAVVAVVLNPGKVIMLVVCSAGVIFMIRFLIALLADERKFRARYLIHFVPSDQQRSASTSEEHRYAEPIEEKSCQPRQIYPLHSMPGSGVGERPRL